MCDINFCTYNFLSTFLHVLFYSLGTGKETEETNLLQQLSDACLVVDALEPSVREELVKNFCSRELTSYQQIFEGAGLSNFFIFIYAIAFQFFLKATLIS